MEAGKLLQLRFDPKIKLIADFYLFICCWNVWDFVLRLFGYFFGLILELKIYVSKWPDFTPLDGYLSHCKIFEKFVRIF